MKLINYALLSMMALMPQAVWAIKLANDGNMPAPTTSVPETIERGGTITAVNRQARTITVDGATYTLGSGVGQGLKPNMQVVFRTVKGSYGVETITAIQQLTPRGK